MKKLQIVLALTIIIFMAGSVKANVLVQGAKWSLTMTVIEGDTTFHINKTKGGLEFRKVHRMDSFTPSQMNELLSKSDDLFKLKGNESQTFDLGNGSTLTTNEFLDKVQLETAEGQKMKIGPTQIKKMKAAIN